MPPSCGSVPTMRLHGFVAGSAMTHIPLAQLRRNLALVIGNAGDDEALAALGRPGHGVRNAAHSAASPVVRDAVDWARRPESPSRARLPAAAVSVTGRMTAAISVRRRIVGPRLIGRLLRQPGPAVPGIRPPGPRRALG